MRRILCFILSASVALGVTAQSLVPAMQLPEVALESGPVSEFVALGDLSADVRDVDYTLEGNRLSLGTTTFDGRRLKVAARVNAGDGTLDLSFWFDDAPRHRFVTTYDAAADPVEVTFASPYGTYRYAMASHDAEDEESFDPPRPIRDGLWDREGLFADPLWEAATRLMRELSERSADGRFAALPGREEVLVVARDLLTTSLLWVQLMENPPRMQDTPNPCTEEENKDACLECCDDLKWKLGAQCGAIAFGAGKLYALGAGALLGGPVGGIFAGAYGLTMGILCGSAVYLGGKKCVEDCDNTFSADEPKQPERPETPKQKESYW